MHIALLVLFRTNIVRFYKSIWKAMLISTTSRSSMGILPLSIDGLNKYVTTSSIATFVPTMGTTLGMNGCGLCRRISSSISNHGYEILLALILLPQQ